MNNFLFKSFLRNKGGIIRVLGAVLIILLVVLLDVECFFQRFFNIPCLGCGMTRAWKAVFQGDFSRAFEYHRAYWTVPFLFIYIFKGKLLFKQRSWNIIEIGRASCRERV